MSGIVGIIDLDFAPVDRLLLGRLTRSLSFRGPDGLSTHADRYTGFGHALLSTTTDEVPIETRPDTRRINYGDLWITEDARIDGRAELVDKLESKARAGLKTATDRELIVSAYVAWGEDCVSHLVGDFSFAIWDRKRERLFCARDHFGVKPFYYAVAGRKLVFSNTLDVIRMCPLVSNALNDQVIADFLLADTNHASDTTAYRGISRLPAAHYLTWSKGSLKVARYWRLPVDEPLRYRDSRDYSDHFKQLLAAAVSDRLRTRSAGMLMSGGVDSTAVVTTARELLSQGPRSFDLRGYTAVYDRLIPDRERYYAGLSATALGIPITYHRLDDYSLYERFDSPEIHKPEPNHWPLEAQRCDLYSRVAARHRVCLTGDGGDPLSYYGSLLNTPRFYKHIPAAISYLYSRRRIPGIGLRTRVKRLLGKYSTTVEAPAWINPDFAARADLRARLEEINREPPVVHPVRAKAYQYLSSPYWQTVFESNDPGATRLPLEIRNPLFDVRLVKYFLAIPLIPWCVDKELLRSVVRGKQPEELRRRPKSPLAADPVLAHLRREPAPALDSLAAAAALAEYVRIEAVPPLDAKESYESWVNLRPLSLNYWLKHKTDWSV